MNATERAGTASERRDMIGHTTARALGWQTLGTLFVQVTQAVVTLGVASQVAPEQYALWGIAAIIVNAQHLIGSLGLAPALVYHRKRRWFGEAVDSAFVVTVVLGGLGALLLALAAPLASQVFREGFDAAETAAVLRAMSLVFLFLTIANVPQALIEKALDFRRRAIPDIVASAVYAVVAFGLLSAGFGVWSLIAAKVVQSGLLAGLYWMASPVKPRLVPRFSRRLARMLFKYGKFLTAAAVIGFAIGNLDTVLVGRLAGAADLGVYALAFTITNLVPTFLSLTLGKVFFPLYSVIRDDRPAMLRAVGNAVHMGTLAILPTTVVLLTVAPEALVQLFGAEWAGATSLVRILAIYGLGRTMGSMMTALLAATGKPEKVLNTFLVALAASVVLVFPLARLGAVGIAMAFSVGQVLAAAYAASNCWQYLKRDVLKRVVPPVAATAVGVAASYLAQAAGLGSPVLLLALFTLAYCSGLVWFDSEFRSGAIRILNLRAIPKPSGAG